MDARGAAHLALTAAAGHRSGEHETGKLLTRSQRRLWRRLFNDRQLYEFASEHFRAKALRDWGDAVERQVDSDERTLLLRMELDPDRTPVQGPRSFLTG